MTARDSMTVARARTPGVGVVIPLHGGARSSPRPDTERDNRWITRCTKGGGKLADTAGYVRSSLKRAWHPGRRHLKYQPSSRTGENRPYGMIGGSRKRRHHAKPATRLDPTRPDAP